MAQAAGKHSCFELYQTWAAEQHQADERAAEPITAQEVEAIRRRLGKATRGPWEWTETKWNDHKKLHVPNRIRDHWVFLLQGRRHYFSEDRESKVLGLRWSSLKGDAVPVPLEANKDLIANAPNDLRRLCDALEAAWAEIAALKRQQEPAGLIVATENEEEEEPMQRIPTLEEIQERWYNVDDEAWYGRGDEITGTRANGAYMVAIIDKGAFKHARQALPHALADVRYLLQRHDDDEKMIHTLLSMLAAIPPELQPALERLVPLIGAAQGDRTVAVELQTVGRMLHRIVDKIERGPARCGSGRCADGAG